VVGSLLIYTFLQHTTQELEHLLGRPVVGQPQVGVDVLFRYLIGQDINSRSDQSPSRWVINFFNWDREQAEAYTDVFSIVRERVLPEREKIVHEASRKKGTAFFWQYDSIGKSLYETIARLKSLFARSRVSNIHSVARIPTGIVFSDATVVFAFDEYGAFAILQSCVHICWLERFSSTMRTDVRYTPSSCFDTFPFPQGFLCRTHAKHQGLNQVGESAYAFRQDVMLARQEGLTKTYNRFNDPEETAKDIQKLRELHVEMDKAVAAAYGWVDLDLGHGFHETKQGVRFTISEAARREVLGGVDHNRARKKCSRRTGPSSITMRNPGFLLVNSR
jgi:hypothetical protein